MKSLKDGSGVGTDNVDRIRNQSPVNMSSIRGT